VAIEGLDGIQGVLAALSKATDDIKKAVAAGVYLEGNNIVGDAKDNTPLKFGTMRASLYCTIPEIQGDKISAEVGGGGPAGKYIIKQHEGDFAHEHGTRKFLERAINNAAGGYVRSVGELALQNIGAAVMKGANAVKPDNPEAVALSNKEGKK